MASLREYRARVPVVARMVDKAFNGDQGDDETPVDFVLITSKRHGEHFVTATVANFEDAQAIIELIQQAFAEGEAAFGPLIDEPVGHA